MDLNQEERSLPSEARKEAIDRGSNSIPTAFPRATFRERKAWTMDLSQTEVLREAQVLGRDSNPIPTVFRANDSPNAA